MGYKTEYTAVARKTIFVVFKCERCGKITVSPHTLMSTSSFRHRGDNIFSGSVESQESSADRKATEQNRLLTEKVLKDAENKEYRSAKFTCRCKHCKKKPLWAKLNYGAISLLTKLAMWVIIMIGVCSLLSIVDDNFVIYLKTVLPAVLGIAGVVLTAKIGTKIHGLITQKKIKKLQEIYLPILCATPEEAVETADKIAESNGNKPTFINSYN